MGNKRRKQKEVVVVPGPGYPQGAAVGPGGPQYAGQGQPVTGYPVHQYEKKKKSRFSPFAAGAGGFLGGLMLGDLLTPGGFFGGGCDGGGGGDIGGDLSGGFDAEAGM